MAAGFGETGRREFIATPSCAVLFAFADEVIE
jgi:hypothetical protein